ncbi:MAG: hypothetical protein P8M30_20280 [Planctomycetaceae bacterium]|nr:hypothetical protein [Planctomycetaceae bacterium]
MNDSPSAPSNANIRLVTRSAIGEANVVNMMREVNTIIGGEGNGGIIAEAPEESVAHNLIEPLM